MKLTKKAAALLLAASLAVSVCATPVFAEDAGTTTPNMGSQEVKGTSPVGIGVGHTTVLYKVTESYIWSVPITIDFGENAGPESKTRVVEANLKTGNGTVAGATNGTAPKVMVTKNVIGVGKTLKIAVSTDARENVTIDDNGFYVKSGTEKLYFTITKPAVGVGSTAKPLDKTDNEVIRVPSGTNMGEQALEFKLTTTPDTAEKAGKYEGSVVFSSSIVD
jgi:hypothetical protein